MPTKRPTQAPPSASAPAPAGLSRSLRRYLYVTACLTGAAVMVVEILGAKMLAPYFGTSHFVWTAQITVTLAALACGYYAGGRLVDRSARLGRLYGAILAAALALVLTVALRVRVAYWLLALPLPAGSLLASLFLFFVPLGLLAMTGPFLARVVTGSLDEVGRAVGRLTAISTIGSVLGAAAIGYLLIPLVPNSWSMYGTAAVLAALCIGYVVFWRRRAASVIATAACLAAGIGLGAYGLTVDGPRISRDQELFRGNSSYGMLQVLQPRGHPYRYYLTDYLIQNTYDTVRGQSTAMFTWMLEALAEAYTSRLDEVLCIGMGVGIVPRELARRGAQVDVVEINPAVVALAKEYFDLDPEAFDLEIGDGRWYLNRAARQYDAVILDAFVGDGSPCHLMSREAFAAISRALAPEGVLVMNTFVDVEAPRAFFGASLYRTLRSVFADVQVHWARGANTLFVASQRSPLTVLREPDFSDVHPDAAAHVRNAFMNRWQPRAGEGVILTDDYNPVEFYDAAHREEFRRALALSMRTLP